MIRESKPEDTDTILRIWLEASCKAHDFVPSAFWEGQVEALRDTYLPSAVTYVYVDRATGAIAGFVSLAGQTIAALFVHPSAQQKGVGKQLMRFVKQKQDPLVLHVYAENAAALVFYKKQGFRIRRKQIDRQTGHPEYVMDFAAARSRIGREKRVVERMIRLYCTKKEGNAALCPACDALLRYAFARLDSCRFGEGKTACKRCPVHCYKPAMREHMREVMRFAGPRMIRYAPWEAIRHLFG